MQIIPIQNRIMLTNKTSFGAYTIPKSHKKTVIMNFKTFLWSQKDNPEKLNIGWKHITDYSKYVNLLEKSKSFSLSELRQEIVKTKKQNIIFDQLTEKIAENGEKDDINVIVTGVRCYDDKHNCYAIIKVPSLTDDDIYVYDIEKYGENWGFTYGLDTSMTLPKDKNAIKKAVVNYLKERIPRAEDSLNTDNSAQKPYPESQTIGYIKQLLDI